MMAKGNSGKGRRRVRLLADALAVAAFGFALALSAGTIADAVTHAEIRTLLVERLGAQARGIHVAVHRGTVVLTGSVDERPPGELARDVALSVSGVSHVEQNIRPVGAPAAPAKKAVPSSGTDNRDTGHEVEAVGARI